MTWLFGQVWLWSLLAFLLGALVTWLLVARPARARAAKPESRPQEAAAPAEPPADSRGERTGEAGTPARPGPGRDTTEQPTTVLPAVPPSGEQDSGAERAVDPTPHRVPGDDRGPSGGPVAPAAPEESGEAAEHWGAPAQPRPAPRRVSVRQVTGGSGASAVRPEDWARGPESDAADDSAFRGASTGSSGWGEVPPEDVRPPEIPGGGSLGSTPYRGVDEHLVHTPFTGGGEIEDQENDEYTDFVQAQRWSDRERASAEERREPTGTAEPTSSHVPPFAPAEPGYLPDSAPAVGASRPGRAAEDDEVSSSGAEELRTEPEPELDEADLDIAGGLEDTELDADAEAEAEENRRTGFSGETEEPGTERGPADRDGTAERTTPAAEDEPGAGSSTPETMIITPVASDLGEPNATGEYTGERLRIQGVLDHEVEEDREHPATTDPLGAPGGGVEERPGMSVPGTVRTAPGSESGIAPDEPGGVRAGSVRGHERQEDDEAADGISGEPSARPEVVRGESEERAGDLGAPVSNGTVAEPAWPAPSAPQAGANMPPTVSAQSGPGARADADGPVAPSGGGMPASAAPPSDVGHLKGIVGPGPVVPELPPEERQRDLFEPVVDPDAVRTTSPERPGPAGTPPTPAVPPTPPRPSTPAPGPVTGAGPTPRGTADQGAGAPRPATGDPTTSGAVTAAGLPKRQPKAPPRFGAQPSTPPSPPPMPPRSGRPVAPSAPPPAPATPPVPPRPAGPPPGPYGPNSALPKPDGSAPSPEFTVKGNASAMLFHTPDSPYYARTRAEVWFRSAEDAERAGFRAWNKPR